MIHFVRSPKRFSHTDRFYLTQWFYQDILIVTDVDINHELDLQSLIESHQCKNVIVDLSHNAMPETELPSFLRKYPILSTYFDQWYNQSISNVYFFPLWFWMFSCRSNQFFGPVSFDAGGMKIKPIMCLNRNLHGHRQKFMSLIQSILSDIEYSYGSQKTLPEDQLENGVSTIDIGVGHRVYSECAVNVVTETVMDRKSLSEKSCKPFVARQIPLIMGPMGANQFLSDIGFDMFEDLIPWREWDSDPDEATRIQKLADFTVQWSQSGKILDQYRSVVHRVERNKTYIHSDLFRSVILKQIPKLDPYAVYK